MNMKISHIRWIAIAGLLAILSLQYVWLVNTYKLTEESVQAKCELVFKDAMLGEVFLRVERFDKKNKTDTLTAIKLKLSETFETEDSIDNANQWLMSNLHISFQETLLNEFYMHVSLPALDSIYTAKLAAEGIKAKVVCCLADSLGYILDTSKPLKVDACGILKTELQPINFMHTRNLQAFIVNPYWIVFQKMTLLLIATVLIMALVIYCIVYQIRIIARQNKIAQLREDFSYAMIHDMKTPLCSILMGIQMLQSGKLDNRPEIRAKYLHILKDEGEHLLALTNRALALSKLENHQLRLVKEDIEIRPMVDDLIEVFTAKADKPVRFAVYLETETVYADEEFLKEAISNLIDNSIKYSKDSVDITVSSLQRPDGSYVIKVKDNGLGIPLKDQSRIFEKYERASVIDRSRRGAPSGFGLGLNYVLRVAEAHGGTVKLESIEGEYSEFLIFLPGNETLNG